MLMSYLVSSSTSVCLLARRMAAVRTGNGTVASVEDAKAVDTKPAQAKKAGVSLHDDRDLEGNIKDQAIKVSISTPC